MSIKGVMQRAANKIKPAIRKELRVQGHYLSGDLERSLSDIVASTNGGTLITGTALHYARFLNDGFGPDKANWGQLPFLIKYFKRRGLSQKDAERAAGGTIMTWMKEGMPSDNSKVYSRTNNRLKFIKIVDKAINRDINKFISTELDTEISKVFNKTKSETI